MTPPVSIRESLAVKHLLTIHDSEASGEEIEQAIAWIESSAENQEAFQRAQRFWSQCDGLANAPAPRALARPRRRRRAAIGWSGRQAATAAAVVLLLAGAAVVGLQIHPGLQRPSATAPALRTYYTTVGEIRVVPLPDGSRVTLAGASAFSFRDEPQRRQAVLTDGEAIFDVAKDPARPFIVRTGSGSVTALGTRFDVRHDMNGVTVTLARGAVKVNTTGQAQASSVVLEPGSQVTYMHSGELGAVHKVDIRNALSWEGGSLYFVREPLDSVVFELNRYSRKPIVIESPEARAIPISGIAKIDGISDWLRGVASVTGIKLVENDEMIRLTADPRVRRADLPERNLTQ